MRNQPTRTPAPPAGQPAPEPAATRRRFITVTEACRRLRIRPHVLRYWEREFEISLKRNSAGRRIISTEQLQKLEVIRHLLHVERMTVHGARRKLEKLRTEPPVSVSGKDQRELLLWLQRQLIGLKSLLESAPERR